MSQTVREGPFKTLKSHDGTDVPFYILQFDKHGSLLSVSENAKNEIAQRASEFTDIFFFSHGWNNDWTVAKSRYLEFFQRYLGLRKTHNLAMPADYKPLLVGVFWPSTALVFGESERGPQKAFEPGIQQDEDLEAQFAEGLEAAGELLDEQDREELYSLAQSDSLSEDSASRLAELAGKISPDTEAEITFTEQADANAILDGWKQASQLLDAVADDVNLHTKGMQSADKAYWYTKLDPRRIIRLLTVAIMKDRAGVVGHGGVGKVLQTLLDHSAARIHLIGHSYGAKVMLSALSATRPTSRKVHSALLLQPAISHLAFASSVPGRTGAGGYHDLLKRVDAPILSTHSKHDFSLHKIFHLVLRRKKDLGEAHIKKIDMRQPSRYAALGGYGPRVPDEQRIQLQPPASLYKLDNNVRIYGVNGSAGEITDHGDVVTEFTAWALYTLVTYRVSE